MSWKLPKLLPIVLFILTFLQTASPLPTTSNATGTGHGIHDWFRGVIPDRSDGTLHSEIVCYSLPYGLIGTISDVLTWYTIGTLAYGISPWRPWRDLESPRFDMFLTTVGLLGGLLLTIFAMIRCQKRWQFMLIAVWKALLTLSNGAFSLHISVVLTPYKPFAWWGEMAEQPERICSYNELRGAMWWLVIYILGTLFGLVGLVSLVIMAWEDNKVVELTTYIFGGIAVVVTVVLWALGPAGEQLGFGVLVLLLTLGVIAALYSDWVLAGLAENLSGMPYGDVVPLYFSYFAAKRLPMFSF